MQLGPKNLLKGKRGGNERHRVNKTERTYLGLCQSR